LGINIRDVFFYQKMEVLKHNIVILESQLCWHP